MDYYIHIKPSFDCLLKADDLSIELKKNRINSFLVQQNENILTLSFYPLEDNQNLLPFSTSIRLKEQVLTNNFHNIELVSFSSDTLLLLVNPFTSFLTNSLSIKSKSLNFANTLHTLYWCKNDPFKIRIENEQNSIDLSYNKIIVDLNTKISSNKLFIYAKTNTNTYVTSLIEYKNNKYKIKTLEEVDILEKQTDKILTYKKLNDIAKHGITKEYNFNSEHIVTTSLVYANNTPNIVSKIELVPYAFFDAVKSQNYDLAREYLTDELSKKLTDLHLEKFFGKFNFITQSLLKDAKINEIALIYKDNNKSIAKIYLVELNHNKISNILEI